MRMNASCKHPVVSLRTGRISPLLICFPNYGHLVWSPAARLCKQHCDKHPFTCPFWTTSSFSRLHTRSSCSVLGSIQMLLTNQNPLSPHQGGREMICLTEGHTCHLCIHQAQPICWNSYHQGSDSQTVVCQPAARASPGNLLRCKLSDPPRPTDSGTPGVRPGSLYFPRPSVWDCDTFKFETELG